MPLRIDLYALAAEDMERMEACYRLLGFASRRYDKPVSPSQARAWLESCAPLLERLGSQMSEELRTRVEQVRGPGPVAPGDADKTRPSDSHLNVSSLFERLARALAPGDADKTRQFDFNLKVYALFEQLAAEYLKHGTRIYEVRSFVLREEEVWECFERLHFDRDSIVPTVSSVFRPPRGRAFASAPTTHTASGRYYLWRGPRHLHAFFKAPRDPLTPPTPEQVIALKKKRFRWVNPKDPLGEARRAIQGTQVAWNTMVEMMRTAARLDGAFLSKCEDITPYD